jgi:hypothetical protein
MPSETIRRVRELLVLRQRELRDELQQIEKALAGLNGRGRQVSRAARSGPRRRPGRQNTNSRRGDRAEQALKLIRENPGIAVRELAQKMVLKHPNYLYRLLPDLEKTGKVRKDGKGYRANR